MPFVLDASVTIAWCFSDQTTPYAESVLDRLRNTEAFTPPIWPLEVANVLLVGERRQRLTQVGTTRFLEFLGSLPIRVDEEALARALGSVLAVGREFRLSAYDAAYLELAARRGLPLATEDEGLMAAAARLRVQLLG